jgi:uncharacterized protein (TIGR03437 family)
MLPGNVVPPVTGVNATGTATIAAHVVRDSSGTVISGSVDFSVNFNFPSDTTITGLHLHPGAAGVALPPGSGAVTIESGVTPTTTVAVTAGAGSLNRQGQVTADNQTLLATLRGLLQDPSQYFVDLHAAGNPGGVIRGQLERAEVVHLMAFMTPANEVPPNIGLNASGVAQVIVIATRDASGNFSGGRVTQVVNYSFPTQVTFTGFHIHAGPPGVAAGVTISAGLPRQDSDPSGRGVINLSTEVSATQTAALQTIAGLFSTPGNYYINLHTTEYPGGAIRASLRKADVVRFPVTMTPAAEVPPVTGLNASAVTNVGVATLRADDGSVVAGFAIFDVNYRFPAADTFTGLHIHDGGSTIAGPVRINSGLSTFASDTGFGNFYFVTTPQTGATMLASLNSLVNTPENHYVNLHTSAFPGGAVRAQLGTALTSAPTVATALSAVLDAGTTRVAPLGLVSLFGANLARITTDLGGGNNPPETLGGATVDIGGRRARLLYASPTQINAQVPATVAIGTVPLTVNNGTATSASVNVTVDAAAPAIFFSAAGGAVLKNANFSLVSASNPAQAGDILLIYSTGLGLTTPPLATGALATAEPLANTATARVTIGGQTAEVLYSIAAPGFVGLYQTAVRMPAGVAAGNAPVVLSVGTANSNSVTIVVR